MIGSTPSHMSTVTFHSVTLTPGLGHILDRGLD
ncbi:MAG: hypothetical protein ACJA2K_000825 [Thalassolituus sp.]|jgi:hypothetical protein